METYSSSELCPDKSFVFDDRFCIRKNGTSNECQAFSSFLIKAGPDPYDSNTNKTYEFDIDVNGVNFIDIKIDTEFSKKKCRKNDSFGLIDGGRKIFTRNGCDALFKMIPKDKYCIQFDDNKSPVIVDEFAHKLGFTWSTECVRDGKAGCTNAETIGTESYSFQDALRRCASVSTCAGIGGSDMPSNGDGKWWLYSNILTKTNDETNASYFFEKKFTPVWDGFSTLNCDELAREFQHSDNFCNKKLDKFHSVAVKSGRKSFFRVKNDGKLECIKAIDGDACLESASDEIGEATEIRQCPDSEFQDENSQCWWGAYQLKQDDIIDKNRSWIKLRGACVDFDGKYQTRKSFNGSLTEFQVGCMKDTNCQGFEFENKTTNGFLYGSNYQENGNGVQITRGDKQSDRFCFIKNLSLIPHLVNPINSQNVYYQDANGVYRTDRNELRGCLEKRKVTGIRVDYHQLSDPEFQKLYPIQSGFNCSFLDNLTSATCKTDANGFCYFPTFGESCESPIDILFDECSSDCGQGIRTKTNVFSKSCPTRLQFESEVCVNPSCETKVASELKIAAKKYEFAGIAAPAKLLETAMATVGAAAASLLF